MSIPPNIRQELIRLSSKSATRKAVFTSKAPTKWHPEQVYDPATGQPFTKDAAWERVRTELENCDLKTRVMDHPPGKIGYWFHFHDAKGTKIYVKLQLGSGFVLGRSFHVHRP